MAARTPPPPDPATLHLVVHDGSTRAFGTHPSKTDRKRLASADAVLPYPPTSPTSRPGVGPVRRRVRRPPRPAPLFVRNDFWVQGLSLGLEWRY